MRVLFVWHCNECQLIPIVIHNLIIMPANIVIAIAIHHNIPQGADTGRQLAAVVSLRQTKVGLKWKNIQFHQASSHFSLLSHSLLGLAHSLLWVVVASQDESAWNFSRTERPVNCVFAQS